MSAHVLVTGQLFRAAEQRTSKSGKAFTTATIRCKDGEGSQWWKVVAFSETAGAELMRLKDGDALSVQGSLKVETYEKAGETKLSLTCMADAVLPLRSAPKQRQGQPAGSAEAGRPPARPCAPAYGDDIPF